MTYALGRGVEYYDAPAVRAILRDAAPQQLPLLVHRSRHRQERAVPDEESRVMIITKKALSRRTVLRGMGVSLALPLLDAMVPALTAAANTAAKPVRRYGFFYMPNGVAMNHTGVNYWKPKTVGADFEFSPILKPLEPFRNQVTVVSGLHNRPGREPRRRQRRSHAQHRLVADRRAHQAHRRVGPAQRHLGRPGDRRAVQAGHAAAVARARHSAELGDRRLRHRLQLRLRHHAGVGVAVDAAADAEQPAPRVRAAVRRRRSGVAQRLAAAQTKNSILDSAIEEMTRLQVEARARRIAPTVSDYLDVLREVERRIQQTEAKNAEIAAAGVRPARHRRARAVRRSRAS